MPSNNLNSPGQLTLSLGPTRRIFTVSELNTTVQDLFEEKLGRISVSGEISGCRPATSGHLYFVLKDASSQVKCVLFRNASRFVRFKPQDGLSVVALGDLEVYQARGEYQLIVDLLEVQGSGSLQTAFEHLKLRLAAEGLFLAERKKPLPKMPCRIGLVTSPNGAVLHDMLHILERRFPGLHIRLYPAQVQGDGSVEQICRALLYFSQHPWADVIILARGGGSLEDLWTFNEEQVARAIYASAVPVISAVGHETDFTISDFVADYRAPTPSAAAEIVICTRESLLLQSTECLSRMIRAFRYRLALCSQDLHKRGTERAFTLVTRAIGRRMQQTDELDLQLRRLQMRSLDMLRARHADLIRRLHQSNLPLRFARSRHRHEILAGHLRKAWSTHSLQLAQRLGSVRTQLVQLGPLAVLERGYAIVEKKSGQVVRSADEASSGEVLNVRLHRGTLKTVVAETAPVAGDNDAL